jgi:hypothetical protein
MDLVLTYTEELAAAKTTAHNALTSALATYVQTDYTEANWTTLTGFKTTGDTAINAAATLEDVTTAQTTAINGMAGVDSIADTLAAAKTAAHTALSDAMAGYTEDYTAANWIALTGYKTAGDDAIDAATTIADVTAAKDATIAAMDAVKTIPELEADATAAGCGLHAESSSKNANKKNDTILNSFMHNTPIIFIIILYNIL